MKILITGGCGFLGSHICEYYRKQGEEVIALDNLTKHELMRTGYNVEKARLYNWNYLKQIGVELYESDIRERNERYIDSVWQLAKDCDFICHTAAQPSMTISIEQPIFDFENNVLGTLNVLEAARRYDVPVVNCSTIHVYGNGINNFLVEDGKKFRVADFRNGISLVKIKQEIDENAQILTGLITPLHASKRTTEIYTQAYIDTYGLRAASFRLTGMYGERQFGGEDHGWVANFVIRTILRLPITIYGTDKQVRDILYVKDAVKAFDAFFNYQRSGIYNIGGGIDRLISLRECLELIEKMTGIKQDIRLKEAREGDLWYFCCDISKAREELNWEPEVSNEKGLRKLIDWVEENRNLFEGREK